MDDIELIKKAKDGDRAALEQLVKKYEKTIFNFAFKVCRDRQKAENTMQETFLSMVKSLHTFDGASKLSTWLYRIAVNSCLMDARTRKKHTFVDLESDEDGYLQIPDTDRKSLPVENIERKEMRKILDAAINKLPPDYRIVFLLRDVEELSTEETAKTTNLSAAAVKSRLHRARAFLRNEISKN